MTNPYIQRALGAPGPVLTGVCMCNHISMIISTWKVGRLNHRVQTTALRIVPIPPPGSGLSCALQLLYVCACVCWVGCIVYVYVGVCVGACVCLVCIVCW